MRIMLGLEEVADGVYDLHSRFYQIGRYGLQPSKTQENVSKAGLRVRPVDLASRV